MALENISLEENLGNLGKKLTRYLVSYLNYLSLLPGLYFQVPIVLISYIASL